MVGDEIVNVRKFVPLFFYGSAQVSYSFLLTGRADSGFTTARGFMAEFIEHPAKTVNGTKGPVLPIR